MLILDGPDAVSYQFAQVGNDAGGQCKSSLEWTIADRVAQKFLSSLDDDPAIGRLIDQTMSFEAEEVE